MAERPNPEVTERPTRRSFTVDYKLRILDEAAACTETRQVGALLRRPLTMPASAAYVVRG